MYNSVQECTPDINSDLASVVKWCESNKLTINAKKTKTMTFSSRQIIKKITYEPTFLYNELIDHVPSYKYLGITLDSCLTFSKHIANLIKVLNHKVYLLNKVRPNLNRKASITIYKSMILPHIDYGDLFYSASNQNLLDKIQRIQKRCLKICLNTNPPPNIGQAHSMTKVNYLSDRRQSHLLNFVFSRTKRTSFIDSRVIVTRTHDEVLLKVEQPRCAKFTHSILYKGALVWNGLDKEYRALTDGAKFKRSMKKSLWSKLS